MKAMWSKVFTIFWKDTVAELRTREIITSVLVFAVLVLVIFSFAFDPEAGTMGLVGPGVLWVSFTFAGVLGLNRIFSVEMENSCLDGLKLCPVERNVIFWGKMVSSFTFMLAVEIIITPIFLVLFNLPLFMPRLFLIVVLATAGFASVGTLFSALSMNTKARDILLPILFLPIVVPVIIAGVEATALALDGKPWGDLSVWLQIIVASDIIYFVVATLVFDFVIEE
ncbi:MAG: heme exporter protein CcmB [Dehalococcoidales bacterium]|nr:MAG: heme exporter protein CcmB [Dehalococcoidales bacterium]